MVLSQQQAELVAGTKAGTAIDYREDPRRGRRGDRKSPFPAEMHGASTLQDHKGIDIHGVKQEKKSFSHRRRSLDGDNIAGISPDAALRVPSRGYIARIASVQDSPEDLSLMDIENKGYLTAGGIIPDDVQRLVDRKHLLPRDIAQMKDKLKIAPLQGLYRLRIQLLPAFGCIFHRSPV